MNKKIGRLLDESSFFSNLEQHRIFLGRPGKFIVSNDSFIMVVRRFRILGSRIFITMFEILSDPLDYFGFTMCIIRPISPLVAGNRNIDESLLSMNGLARLRYSG